MNFILYIHMFGFNKEFEFEGGDYAWFADWLLRIGEGREQTYPEMGE